MRPLRDNTMNTSDCKLVYGAGVVDGVGKVDCKMQS